MTTHSPSVNVSDLRRSFGGEIIGPDDDAYEAARQVWNLMIDKRPALIVRPNDPSDVAAAIGFGRRAGLEIGVRGGGHSVVGLSVPEGGLMIDLSRMRAVRVDPERRRAWVQGGALLGDLDGATTPHRLATPAGNIGLTGVGGLTLGGGEGWLGRQFGLTSDNVVSAEIVTADGGIHRVSETDEPDLYWAIRGGGGNFGVVTEFEFRLHPIAGTALMVDFFHDIDEGPAIVRDWRDLAVAAPREATYTAWLGEAPPWPFLPEQFHGRSILDVGFVWVGDVEAGRRLIEPLRSLGMPLAESIRETTYLGLQSGGDENHRIRRRRYWKGLYFRELPDALLDTFLGRGAGTSPDDGAIPASAAFQALGGAMADLGPDDTAFAHRDARFEMVTSLGWDDAAEDERRMRGVRRFAAALEPFSSGVYVNSLSDEGQSGVSAAYGQDRLRRLVAIKDRYDPENVFHLNHNIQPSGGA